MQTIQWPWVQRARDRATSGIGSAKIFLVQAWLRHRKRRAFSRSSTSQTCQGRSLKRRRLSTVAAPRKLTASRATRELSDVNIQHKPII